MRLQIAIAGVVLCASLGCQTYDFEPVEPLAISQTTQTKTVVGRQYKPNLMLLLDKSGSMAFPAQDNNPNCPSNCGPGNPCPQNCPTRISELRAAMNTFLTTNGDVARMGLTIYPSGNSCAPAGSQEILVPLNQSANDVSAELQATANDINSKIGNLQVSGGTPTAASLRFAGGLVQDELRQDFVLLLTDGLPNCNANNPNTCNNPTACRCTQTTCSGATCSAGCLDKDASIQAVVDLLKQDVRTIVVGFGADFGTTGDGPVVLNAMAEAGGFARSCPMGTDTECGSGNKCDPATKVCQQKFYRASSATELANALAQISAVIGGDSICKYALDAPPSDPRFISVIVDGQSTLPGTETWKYDAGAIELQGALCTKVKAADPKNPVRLEFRIVETL